MAEELIYDYMDPAYLDEKAGLEGTWSTRPALPYPGMLRFEFMTSKIAAVDAALTNYDLDYLTWRKNKKIDDIAIQRRENELKGPNGLVLDDRTVGRLTAAVKGFELCPEVEQVSWEISRGIFMEMPKAMVLAISAASFLHVQACFERARVLSNLVHVIELREPLPEDGPGTALMEAITALDTIPITEDWPVAGV